MSQLHLPLIMEPDELELGLRRRDLLIVDLGDQRTHAKHHVPGAINLEYQRLVMARPPALGLLPDDRHLGEVLSSLGMTPETHVVAYDNGGNAKACRLLWTLDVIGHPNFSLLDGGLHAWMGEGHRTDHGLNQPRQGDYEVTQHNDVVADKAYILAHLDDPGVVILDTRSPAEFSGSDRQAARGGHIPGAVNMNWTLAMDRERNLRLRSEGELREMLEKLGVTPDKEIVTHCQIHQRSSHTYIMLKALGYPRIKGYPGSWSEWGNDLELPIETSSRTNGLESFSSARRLWSSVTKSWPAWFRKSGQPGDASSDE